MPRPRTKSDRTIIADADGSLLFWQDGTFSGDSPELVAAVRRAVQVQLPVSLTVHGPVVTADDFSVLGAAAALLAAVPGRVTLLEAPPTVLDMFPEFEDDNDPEDVLLSGDTRVLQDGLVTERVR